MSAAEKALPSGEDVFLERFRARGGDLWKIAFHSAASPENAVEDFVSVLQMVRRRSDASLRRASEDEWLRRFLREWMRIQKESAPADASETRDRALLAALFVTTWKPEDVSYRTETSLSLVRGRARQALFRLAGFGVRDRAQTRDCVRSDLRLFDELLGLRWKDPLRLFTEQKMQAHRDTCSRCRRVSEGCADVLEKLRETSVPAVPRAAQALVEEKGALGSRLPVVSGFATWPWYVRFSMQLLAATMLVFFVVGVPYIGDLFPAFRRTADVWKHSVETAWRGLRPERKDVSEVPPVVPPPVEVETPPNVAKVETPAPPTVGTPAPVLAKGAPTPEKAPAPPALPAKTPAAPVAEVAGGEPEDTSSFDAHVFYQWNARARGAADLTPRIVALFSKYGAENAGSLKFGSRYLGGYYYHFTIPEGSFAAFEKELKATMPIDGLKTQTARGVKARPKGRARIVFLLKEGGGGAISPESRPANPSPPPRSLSPEAGSPDNPSLPSDPSESASPPGT